MTPKRQDTPYYKNIVGDMLAHGFTIADLSYLTHIPENTIRSWVAGGNIGFRTPEKALKRLEEVWKQVRAGKVELPLPYPTKQFGRARKQVLAAL